MKFEDISKCRELIDYLDDSGERLKNSDSIFHYTTIDNCINIFKSRTWHLGNPKNMNDKLEYSNGDEKRWENIFFASFMSNADESIAMWSMYSQPWERGIQLAIKKDTVKKWIKDTKIIREISCKNYMPTNRIIECNDENRVLLSSVTYHHASKSGEELWWNTVANKKLTNADRIPELTGYVKDFAWKYEQEIRIKAVFNNSDHFERVAIDIPDYVLDDITVIKSPMFNEELLPQLKKAIGKNNVLHDSPFKNNLYIFDPCIRCSYKK